MTTKEFEKLNTEIASLKHDVRTLRSSIIGKTIKDSEGEYRVKFVRDTVIASKRKPNRVFKDKSSFLRSIKNIK